MSFPETVLANVVGTVIATVLLAVVGGLLLGLWRRVRSQITVHSRPSGAMASGDVTQYDLAQVWFVNRSRRRFAGVSATVSVKGEPRRSAGCLWAIGTPTGQMGQWANILPTTDIEANDVPHKLNVALIYPNETHAYLFSLDNRQAHPDFRDPTHELAPGWHAIRLRLSGDGLRRDFHFRLHVGERVRVESGHFLGLPWR